MKKNKSEKESRQCVCVRISGLQRYHLRKLHWKKGHLNKYLKEGARQIISGRTLQSVGTAARAPTQDCLSAIAQVQFSPVSQLCLTLCSTPALPVHHQLPEFTQPPVHWIRDVIQPSHPLLSPSPFPSIPFSSLFKWVSSSHQVAKVLEFQLQHQSFQWIFRTDFL